MDRLSDEQLMEGVQRGQTNALDELYRRYARKLYVFCLHATRTTDPQEPEDLVQDVFIRVIKAADTFNPRKAFFRTWMFRIARNRCIDVLRQRGRIKLIPLGDRTDQDHPEEELVLEDTLAAPDEDLEKAVERDALVEAVRDCIHKLDMEHERQALLLYYLGGKVFREIAEILGKSTSTAKNWVESAQEKVKHCLELKGIFSAF